jgi:type IV pilus assembly protein PilB
MDAHPQKRLGELMVERGLISREQLDHALAEQRLTKEFLGTILVREGWATPEALLAALSARFGIPHESLRLDRVDWSIAKQFPASALAEGKCFPVRANEESVTVAIANPLELSTLSGIERVAGFRRVQPVLVLERELQAVLKAYQQQVLRGIIQNELGRDGRR